MEHIIQQITEHFVSHLPEGEEHYHIKDLKTYHFPGFLVRRIHIELQWNLNKSMILPQTDWANTQSQAVQQAWQHFLSAIHAEVELPASYAKATIETAVANIIEILVQPRTNIPDILFGGEEVLSASALAERTDLLVVYPHFASVLTRYMDRKNKEELGRKQCKKIIGRIDEKVTEQYTPLQWAQMLDPLFTLAQSKVDADLLRLFFEDRDMPDTAEKFDEIKDSISRAEFIEILSYPKLHDYDDYEKKRSQFFEEKAKSADEKKEDNDLSPIEISKNEVTENMEEASPVTAERLQPPRSSFGNMKSKSQKNNSTADEGEADKRSSAKNKENKPDKAVTEQRSDAESNPQQQVKEEDESASLNDIFSDKSSQENEEQDGPAKPAHEPVIDETLNEKEEREAAIWQRYMNNEDEAQNQPVRTVQEKKAYLDRSFIDVGEQSTALNRKNLEKLLGDQKNYFVKELFSGSEEAYEESLQKLAKEDEWEWGSKLIKNNIFKRYNINIYSEAAVDYTDRLQSYFMEKQNYNQEKN